MAKFKGTEQDNKEGEEKGDASLEMPRASLYAVPVPPPGAGKYVLVHALCLGNEARLALQPWDWIEVLTPPFLSSQCSLFSPSRAT